MRRTVTACIVLALAGAPLPGAVQHPNDAAWAGHWTLDRAASSFVGMTVSIRHLHHHYQFGLQGITLTVSDDGSDSPTTPGRTTSFVQTGNGRWRRVHKLNGRTLDTSTFTLAADGRSFLIRTVAVDDTGLKHTSSETFVRQGAGVGINGTWRSTQGGVNATGTIDIVAAARDTLRFTFADQQMSFTTPLDGSAVAYDGAKAVPTVRIAVSWVSPTELRWTDTLNGKPYIEGTYTLSPDAQHLTEVSWHSARPQDKDEAVYRRK